MLLLPCTENWLLNSKTLFQMSNVAIDFNRCNMRPQTFRVTACVHDSCDVSLVNSTTASATTLEFRDFLHTSDNNKLHSMAFLTFESIREHWRAFESIRYHLYHCAPLAFATQHSSWRENTWYRNKQKNYVSIIWLTKLTNDTLSCTWRIVNSCQLIYMMKSKRANYMVTT